MVKIIKMKKWDVYNRGMQRVQLHYETKRWVNLTKVVMSSVFPFGYDSHHPILRGTLTFDYHSFLKFYI